VSIVKLDRSKCLSFATETMILFLDEITDVLVDSHTHGTESNVNLATIDDNIIAVNEGINNIGTQRITLATDDPIHDVFNNKNENFLNIANTNFPESFSLGLSDDNILPWFMIGSNKNQTEIECIISAQNPNPIGTYAAIPFKSGDPLAPLYNRYWKYASTSADDIDNINGTGAKKIELIGLDGDFNTQREILSLQGQTILQTSNMFRYVNHIHVIESGKYNYNLGTISFSASNDLWLNTDEYGNPYPNSYYYNSIPPQSSISHTGVYVVPAGYDLLPTQLNVSNKRKNVSVNVRVHIAIYNITTFQYIASIPVNINVVSEYTKFLNYDLGVIPEKSVIWLTAKCNSPILTEIFFQLTGKLVKKTSFPNALTLSEFF
jgi:hypothetical protein